MIQIKPGVCLHPDTLCLPQVWRIIKHAQLLAPTAYEITITSACDGKHHSKSKHYTGKAFDFRTRDFPPRCKVSAWAKRLQNRLGDEYFVLEEPNHLHVQWNG